MGQKNALMAISLEQSCNNDCQYESWPFDTNQCGDGTGFLSMSLDLRPDEGVKRLIYVARGTNQLCALDLTTPNATGVDLKAWAPPQEFLAPIENGTIVYYTGNTAATALEDVMLYDLRTNLATDFSQYITRSNYKWNTDKQGYFHPGRVASSRQHWKFMLSESGQTLYYFAGVSMVAAFDLQTRMLTPILQKYYIPNLICGKTILTDRLGLAGQITLLGGWGTIVPQRNGTIYVMGEFENEGENLSIMVLRSDTAPHREGNPAMACSENCSMLGSVCLLGKCECFLNCTGPACTNGDSLCAQVQEPTPLVWS